MLDYYWKILLKRWMLIVICFVGVGLAVFVGNKLTTPVYQSATLVQVAVSSNNSQANIDALQASNLLVQTEVNLALSNSVLREVASHYPDISVDELAKNSSASAQTGTQLFQISVTDTSPTRAAAVANDIAGTLIKQQTQATQQHNAQSQQQVQQDLQQTQQQIESVSSQINSLKTKPGSDAQISTLQIQLSGLQQHYTQWQSLLAQLELTNAQSGSFLLIAQPAQPASGPARPNVLSNTVIGLLVGLLNGLFLAILLEQLDTRVHTAEAVTQILEWPVLATIWRLNTSKGNEEEVVNPPPHSPNVEAYRMLRTNLGFTVIDKSLRSIMVTSATPLEGKSTTAANLAIFMALAGKKTLLIDADLRRPTIAKKFHLPPDKMGLTNALVAYAQYLQATSRSLLHTNTPFPIAGFSLSPFMHTVNIPNLQIIPAGPLAPNPPELLDSKAMESFLAAIDSSEAEIIIFDSPPLLGLSDATILAPKTDGMLVVVDVTRSSKKNLKQLKTVITQLGCKVLGCVVNKQRRDRKDTSYYYYYTEEANQNEQNGQSPASPALTGPPWSNSQH